MAEKVTNQLATQTDDQNAKTLSKFLGMPKVQQSLLGTLGNQKEMQKFSSSIISAAAANPDLQNCDFATVVSAGLLANALNLSLSPTLGFAYIVPFKNKAKGEVKDATFVLGYKGYIQLAIRSGYYKKINVLEIKEGELISFDPLNEEIEVRLIQDEEEREKAKTIGYYAMFEHVNGFRKVIYWSKSKMLAHADKYSPAFSKNAVTTGKVTKVSYADYEAGNYPKGDEWKYSSFWYKDFDSMARKTMVRQLISHYGIMSIDMQKAYDADTEAMKNVDALPSDGISDPIGDFFGGKPTEQAE